VTNEELVAEAAMFRSTLPFPDDAEVRPQLEPCVLHDLVKVLRACCSEEHPLSPAKKTAGMFFFGAIVKGEPYLEEMKLYDTVPSERRAQIESAWDGVIAAVEPAEAPPFQFLQYFHHDGRQLDVNVGRHTWVVVGGPSGSYSGGAWREELVRELAAAFGPGGSAG
jgi:hypothetical protein